MLIASILRRRLRENQKPAALERRGGAFYSDAAVELIASLTADRGDVQVVNLVNNGSMPFLPDDHVIEVPARVGASGLEALPIAPLADDCTGLIAHVGFCVDGQPFVIPMLYARDGETIKVQAL